MNNRWVIVWKNTYSIRKQFFYLRNVLLIRIYFIMDSLKTKKYVLGNIFFINNLCKLPTIKFCYFAVYRLEWNSIDRFMIYWNFQ